ncbi:MAG: hypothetical protein ACI835_005051 [Planctomycetota bacterium]|jgi:hypothetical protein
MPLISNSGRDLSLRLISLLALISITSAQCDTTQIASSTPTAHGHYGYKLLLDGDRMFVGEPGISTGTGSVHILERSGTDWIEVDVLCVPSAGATFGWGLAIDDDRLVVGAPWASSSVGGTGIIYIYDEGTNGWTLSSQLEADVPHSGDFGKSIAIDGDQLLIGAPAEATIGTMAGAAYLFEWDGQSWLQMQKLFGDSFSGYELYGSEVQLENGIATISAPGGLFLLGSVFVYERGPGGWPQTWHQKLDPLCQGYGYGEALALEEGRLMIGAPQSNWAGCVDQYDWVAGSFVHTGSIDGPSGNNLFGRAIKLAGKRLLIGSRQAQEGAAALYLNELTGWRETHRFTPPIPDSAGGFGIEVALDGESAWIADPFNGPGDEGLIHAADLRRGARHCSSGPNSTGQAAVLEIRGCAKVSGDDVVLTAGPVPDSLGLFVYSNDRDNRAFGNGRLCLAGAMHVLPMESATHGELRHQLRISNPTSAAGQITAGSTWHFQAWYRDAGTGTSFDTSDAVALTFSP